MPTSCQPELTEEQVRFFRENGFLSIERITTDAEVEWLRGIYDRLFGERVGEERGEYFDLGGPRAHSGREVLPQVLGPERKREALLRELFPFRLRKPEAGDEPDGIDQESDQGGGRGEAVRRCCSRHVEGKLRRQQRRRRADHAAADVRGKSFTGASQVSWKDAGQVVAPETHLADRE